MEKETRIVRVTKETLKASREATYKAFRRNIDHEDTVDKSVDSILNHPKQKLKRYWERNLIAIDPEDGIVAGMCQCPYTVTLRNKKAEMIGMADVFSVKKGTRNIEKLFRTALGESDAELSCLMPFSSVYYSQYGYAPSGIIDSFTFPNEYTKRVYKDARTTLRKVETEEGKESIKALYEEARRGITLMADRVDPLDWQMAKFAKNDEGYLGWTEKDGKYHVVEAWNLRLSDIASFFLKEFPDFVTLRIDDPFHTGLKHEIREYRVASIGKYMNSMTRILDVKKAITGLDIPAGLSIKLRVKDELLERNDKSFLIEEKDGKARVTECPDYDEELSIGTLSYILINGIDEERARHLVPSFKASSVDTLSALFPIVKNCCAEEF